MDDDRRIPKRVRVDGATCELQAKSAPATIDLVNLSPEGACVGIQRTTGVAAQDILEAWLHESPLRIYLGDQGDNAVAIPVWARGPRAAEKRLLFGLRFVQPVADFGSLIRGLLQK